MLKWLFVLWGIATAGLAWWCDHLSGILDEHKATIAVMEQDAIVLKASLNGIVAWTAVTDKALEDHRLAAKRQEAEFRKLQTQVRAAYGDKETSDWGRTRIPDSLRVLLGGKARAVGH